MLLPTLAVKLESDMKKAIVLSGECNISQHHGWMYFKVK